MLAPVVEADAFEPDLLQLSIEGVRRYPAFCAELAEASGSDPAYRASGTLLVARDRDDAEELRRRLEVRRAMALPIERLTPSEARALEPALAPTIGLALAVPDDHSVDPRKLLAALEAAVRAGGGRVVAGRVTGLSDDGERVTGAECDDGAVVPGDVTVVAAGAWTGELVAGAGISIPSAEGADHAVARSIRPGARPARDPHARRLPRAACRRAVRARRLDGGEGLGPDVHGGRDVRAHPGHLGRSYRESWSWRSRSSGPGCARAPPTTCR